MKKDKNSKKLQELDIIKFDDIQQAMPSEPEPQQKFEATIQNGTALVLNNGKKSEE